MVKQSNYKANENNRYNVNTYKRLVKSVFISLSLTFINKNT